MTISKEAGRLAEDARALMAATADVAGEKIAEIRERLAAALDHESSLSDRVRQRSAESIGVADRAMHQHPYQAAAIGIGFGALIGFLTAHSLRSNSA